MLAFMLSTEDPRMEPLREQASAAHVTGMCKCGCATIDLEVDRSKARAARGLSRPAIDSTSYERSDPEHVRELILFLDDGWLASLEVVYYGASPPRLLPEPTDMGPPFVRPGPP